jgi:hypothetical protein
MAIAEATALADFPASFSLRPGEDDIPSSADVEMLLENIKPLRFIAAFVGTWSEDFLSCATPLETLLAALLLCFKSLAE